MSIPNINNSINNQPDTVLTDSDIMRVREYLVDLQARICQALEAQEHDGGGQAVFVPDDWRRPEGGGGRSCILADGKVI